MLNGWVGVPCIQIDLDIIVIKVPTLSQILNKLASLYTEGWGKLLTHHGAQQHTHKASG